MGHDRTGAMDAAGHARSVVMSPPATVPWPGGSVVASLGAAVEQAQSFDVDGADEPGVERLLGGVTDAVRRLQALQARLAGVLQQRRRPLGSLPEVGDRVERQTARYLADELHLAPGEATRAARTGRRLGDSPLLGAMFDAGDLSAEHAAAVAAALADVPVDCRSDLERALVAFARSATPQQVAKEGRRRLALLDEDRADLRERGLHARRRASWWSTGDGGLRVAATVYGVDAEAVRVALDAATPGPGEGEDRSPEQRRADGLVTVANLALQAGQLPEQHGIRPHVQVTVALADLRAWTGVATLGSGEPMPLSQLAGVLRDCTVSRTVLSLTSAPLEGSVASRTVPAALWRALVARDGGCTWAGCDAPASWCQVAHGEVPFAADGLLSPDNAALLCRHHHRRFDRGGWAIRITGDTVTYRHDPDRPSAIELARRHVRGPTRPPGVRRATAARSP